MRYGISGANTTILDATFDATGKAGDPTVLMGGQALLGRALTSGRELWLRSAWMYNASGPVNITLFDASVATNPTSSTRRITIPCASGQATMVDWPAPGLHFATNVVIAKEATDASASFQPGQVGGSGYEEE